jgi:uncharacterized protein
MKLSRWVAAGAATATILAAYSTLVEPRWLQVRRKRIHIRALPPSLEGLRVGLLSDLHFQRRSSTGVLRRAVAALDRERPDLIAVTGDLAEDEEGLQAALDVVSRLDAPLGVFVVPGNHDHHAGIRTWRRAIAIRKALHDLTNRYVLAQRSGATICIAGLDDHLEGRPVLLLPPPGARDLTVVLAHSPDQAERCRRSYDAVDLIVSGHTHGGQVRMPGFRAPVNSATYPELYEDGLRRRPWTQVYTSRGVGTSRLPIRFGARPEVAILHLTREPRPAWQGRAPFLEFPRDSAHIHRSCPPAADDHLNPRGPDENP